MRVRARVERSVSTADLLRDEVTRWLAARAGRSEFRRFGHHFEVLDAVLSRMLSGIRERLLSVPAADSRAAYAACHELDRSLLTVKRLFEWYVPKYDQRLDPVRGPALAAADEVVRSCWWQPFDVLGKRDLAGPLPYLDPFFEAFAVPRAQVADELGLAAELIPVISLPEWSVREAWWLVAAAHETGHVLLHDLDLGYEARSVAGDWAEEVFADVYAALMVGPAAAWVVAELGHGLTADSLYYPPLDRRLSIMELADPLAAAMLDLEVGGVPLPGLAGVLDARLVAAWTGSLAVADPVITKVGARGSARAMIAAGVAARGGPAVQANLLAHLPRCGPEGTMGSTLSRPGVDALADRLTRRVLP
ncbi:MAG: hypothetical protein HOY71_48910 [Nonomuraea sp.]|nr:hypothetical protein [Nonomuraea sp.]